MIDRRIPGDDDGGDVTPADLVRAVRPKRTLEPPRFVDRLPRRYRPLADPGKAVREVERIDRHGEDATP